MFSKDFQKELFGIMPNGAPAYLFTLQNSSGMKIQVTNYGAKVVSAWVSDRNGKFDNVILGYTCLEHYLKGHQYLGATIGRVTNRIGNGKFEMDGQIFNLTKNLGDHHLHGGTVGFESQLWDIVDSNFTGDPWVEFQLISPNGDQGYPGNLTAKVKYSLLQDNSIEIRMRAITDCPTIVNMTNHAYFNLNGKESNDIYKHKVQFFASKFLGVDANSIPSGELLNVEKTVLDFREPAEIGVGINQMVEPVKSTKGYDQFFVSDLYKKGNINLMSEVYEPDSGRVLQVASTLPGMQFYTSNFLETEYPISNGKICGKHSAFCIEPSYFPDAPNHHNFQSIKLNTGDIYDEIIVFKFKTVSGGT